MSTLTSQPKKELPKYFAFGGYPLLPHPYRWYVTDPFRIVWQTPWHYLNPMTYWKTVKYFWQRGSRGYADCDWWNLNSYMAEVNLHLLQQLRAEAHGFPATLDHVEDGEREWMAILRKMILGFEACIQLTNEAECAPAECWGDPIGDGDFNETMRQLNDPSRKGFDPDLFEKWRKPLQQQMDEGFALYAKHFHSLWD